MSDAALPGPPHLTEDEKALHKLGYAQELMRAMGVFRNFAISFTIISILAGCLTSYCIAFQWGGPVAVTWGWLIVGGFTIFVALSMAEIASTYPTAGGLYYWSSKLGSPAWGWFTGWFNLIGLIGIIGARSATALRDIRDGAASTCWWSVPERPSPHLLHVRRLHDRCDRCVNVFDVRITSLFERRSRRTGT